ncbi:MAG: TIR domain-containing protein [Anaerolineales bacterium]|nr:TIR domain-containing protein [Anaerolineales bacterium]
MTHEVFVSYSTKNKDAAQAVVSGLEEQGLRCWIAPRDILPGTPYGESIINAIQGCRIFLLILSEDANGSRQVLREVDHASSLDKDILPFLIETMQPSGSMAYYLGPEQWLEATSSSIEEHVQDLCDIIERLLEREEGDTAAALTGDAAPPMGEKVPDAKPVQKPLTEVEEVELEGGVKDAVEPAFMVRVNPFIFGNPVSTQKRFYGREGDLRQVISRLLSAGESTSVVGERRIGKTSLLKFLANPENANALGLPPEKFCLVYIDFQGLTDITPQRFWQRVLRKMEGSICKPELVGEIQALRERESFDLFDLEDLFEAISRKGISTVLLMDEFEYVTRNPNFKSDFFGGLRALAIHRDLPLITGTRRELVDLCHSDEIKGSPFFNIFVNLVLRPFSRDQLLEMLRGYTAEVELDLTPQEEALAVQLSGGYPFFVQMAGYYLLEAKWKELDGEEVIQDVRTHFDAQADPHFNYFWSHSTESEKITLLSILALSQADASPAAQPTIENLAKVHSRAHLDVPELIKRGMLLKDGEGDIFSVFSSSFVRWIQREIQAASGEEETEHSVEEWISAGGYEDLEPIRGVLPKIKKQYWPLVSKVTNELSYELVGAAAFELITQALL